MTCHACKPILWLVSFCLLGCSGKRERHDPAAGSGSSHAPKTDADTSGSLWQFAGFGDADETHPYAILQSTSRLRLVGTDGTTIADVTPASIEHVLTTSVPGTFIWVDADTIHAVEIPSGHERWTRAVSGRRAIVAADDALAVADDGPAEGSAHGPESLIIDVKSGAVRYREPTRSLSIDASRADHAFVFYGESSVSRIDDATGKARWTTNVPRMDGATADYFDDSIFVVRPDRSYAELTSSSGRLTEGKCKDAESQPHRCLGTPTGASDRFSLGAVHLTRGDVAYAALGTWPHGRTLIARNPVGDIVWKTDLRPCADARDRHGLPQKAFPSNDAVALLVTCSDSSDELMIVGQSDGHIRYRHPFDPPGRFISLNDRCIFVMEGAKVALTCLDPHSGKPIWSAPVFGATSKEATALPLEEGDALLVDSNPLTISRIGADGKRLWQTTLRGTKLSSPRDSDHGIGALADSATSRQWSWSQGMGVLASSRDGEPAKVSVLDLKTGTVREIP